MRKLVAHLIMTLDGVVGFGAIAGTVKRLRDKDVMADFNAALAEEDAILLGRVTYEEWAGYWPTSTYQPFAGHINAVPKFVASRTLKDTPWGASTPARVLEGDVAEAVSALKRQPGRNIGIHGSPTLVEGLLHV